MGFTCIAEGVINVGNGLRESQLVNSFAKFTTDRDEGINGFG
jgi:hypothetical protein